jgi:hypothetical protein
MARPRSPALLAHRVHAADDVAAGVSLTDFADVRQHLRVAEDVDGLLQQGEILGADQDGRRVTVAVRTIRSCWYSARSTNSHR